MQRYSLIALALLVGVFVVHRVDRAIACIAQANVELVKANAQLSATNKHIEELHAKLVDTSKKLDQTNASIAQTNIKFDETNHRFVALDQAFQRFPLWRK